MNELIHQLKAAHIAHEASYPMAKLSTFRIGGVADLVILPENTEQLRLTVNLCHAHQIPYGILGNGSNTLFRDEEYRGAVIVTKRMAWVKRVGTQVCCGSGVMLPKLAQGMQQAGLSGLEFACGIPGSLGGALVMNAGAHGGQIGDLVQSCTVLNSKSDEVFTLNAEALKLGYRDSIFHHDHNLICLEVTLKLTEEAPECIRKKMQEYTAQRREKQPLEYPSVGTPVVRARKRGFQSCPVGRCPRMAGDRAWRIPHLCLPRSFP